MTRRLEKSSERKLQRLQKKRKKVEEPLRIFDITITNIFKQSQMTEAIESWDAIDDAAQHAAATLADILSCEAGATEIKERIAGIDD